MKKLKCFLGKRKLFGCHITAGAGVRGMRPGRSGLSAAPKKFGHAARRLSPQSGRSMIEMLGVLAIIGVLSITALVGFTYAMNKHRANETIYDVMLRGTNVPMVDENYASKPAGHEFRFPDLPAGTYYPMTTKKDSGSSYYVEATGVTYRVCELILKMNPTDIDQIVVNNSVYTGDSDICGTTDGLAMKFCFGSDGTICDGTGHGGSSGGSGSTSGGLGSGSSSGEIGTTCDPACGTCEQCVDGSCEVRPCSISSCPDTQQPTGTDECGCIIGCEDKCPNLSCGTCEVPNYETCSCDIDSSCTCEERGGETIYYLTGTCCEQPSSCCSVDEGCVQEECTITDSTQCGVFCTEGAQTTSVCCTAVSMDGDDPMNHVWVGDRYGEGYCCASKSESQACCEADSGKWCDGTCCGGNQECGENGECISTSCHAAATSGSGTSCLEGGPHYITIAHFNAQTAGEIKLYLERKDCGDMAFLFAYIDDWDQMLTLSCETTSGTQVFSFEPGTHTITVVLTGASRVNCTSFDYILTCE